MAKPYFHYFTVCYKQFNEYKLNLFVSVIKYPITLMLTWFIWKYLFQNNTQEMAGFSFQSIILYYVVLQWVTLLNQTDLSDKISDEIRTGNLNIYMSRPIFYLLAKWSESLGKSSLHFVVSFVPVMLFVAYFIDTSFEPINILYFSFVLILGVFMSGLLETCIGLAGFWMTKVFGLKYFLKTFFEISGGILIPLTFFPKWFDGVTYLSPLRFIYFESYRVLKGEVFTTVIIGQLIWLLVLSFISYLLWNYGVKRFEGSG